MNSKYKHIPFERNWECDADLHELLGRIAEQIELLSELPLLPDAKKSLHNTVWIKGAHATVAIEGNTVSQEDVERMAAGEEPNASVSVYQKQEIGNMLGAFNHYLNLAVTDGSMHLVDQDLILEMHRFVGQDLGEVFEAVPGQYRRNNVTVGPNRAPDYEDVPELMSKLFVFLQMEFGFETGKQTLIQALVQASVAHVNLELIHPFGDGNGRTGRLLEFWLMIRAGVPSTIAHLFSCHYNNTRQEYFHALRQAEQTGTFTGFLQYAFEGLYREMRFTRNELLKCQWQTIWHRHVYDKFEKHETEFKDKTRKRRVRDLALLLPLDEDFSITKMVFINEEIMKLYFNVSLATMVRDIKALVKIELLREKLDKGEKRYQPIKAVLGNYGQFRRK